VSPDRSRACVDEDRKPRLPESRALVKARVVLNRAAKTSMTTARVAKALGVGVSSQSGNLSRVVRDAERVAFMSG
jgi:hypothetical protein